MTETTFTVHRANDNDFKFDVPPRGRLLTEIPPRPKRTPQAIEAEGELGHAFVCLWGLARPRPRKFGDNRGIWPARISVHKNWRDAGKREDHSQPYEELSQWDVIGVQSDAHGHKLKAKLAEMCFGKSKDEEAEDLRHSWFDVAEWGAPEHWWPPMLSHALVALDIEHGNFDVFDIETHNKMVAVRAEAIKKRETGR